MIAKLAITDQFTLIRLVVAYLGQTKQSGWWDSSFLDATGLRFLQTTFPRTAHMAALRSTVEVACTIHDKALGRIGTYHLFRLPAGIEDHLEHAYEKTDWIESWGKITSRDVAMDFLQRTADAFIKAPEGPVQIGVAHRILTVTAIREIAAHYHSAFQDGIRCFPYFAPK